MTNTHTSKLIPDYFNAITTVKEATADYTIFSMNCSDGYGYKTVYPILPGIHLVYNDFKTSSSDNTTITQHNIIEINHCLEGRLECKLQDNCLLYMGEGDLFITEMNNIAKTLEFPLGYYRGISLIINIEEANKKLPLILKDIQINLADVFQNLFIDDSCFLIHAKDKVAHIFTNIYTIPEPAKNAYYKLKIWEIIIYLAFLDTDEEGHHKFYYQQQVDIIKQIQHQLTANLSQRYTINELSQQFGISSSSLKTHFKGVYGVSISNYMKTYRMKQACSLLLQTDESIANAALRVGYLSQSKFTAAFKEIIGVSPLEYRKKSLASNKNINSVDFIKITKKAAL